MSKDLPLGSEYITVVRTLAVITLLVCCTGVLGWVFEIDALRTPISGLAPIRPITAVALSLVAGAILVGSLLKGSQSVKLIRVVGALCTLLGLYVICQYAFGLPSFLDNFLVPGQNFLGDRGGNRMPPQTATNFLLAGLAMILAGRKGRWGQAGGVATLGIFAVTYAVILGLLYHSAEFAGLSTQNAMSPMAAFCFLLVGTALLLMNSECRLIKLFTNDDLGGMAARRLLPVIILIPTVVGWLRVAGQDAQIFETALGTTMAMFLMVTLMFAIVVFYSIKFSEADQVRLATAKELEKREARYRDLFDHNQGMICIHDIDGVLKEVNPAVVTLTGYSADEIVGKNIADFIPPDQRALIGGFFRQIEHEGLSSGLLPIMAKDGRQLTWRYQSVLVNDGETEPYVIGHAVDVTELIAAQQELRNLSLTDELTGLMNRRGFLNLANQQMRLERHSGTARGLVLMFADMDGLKEINDRLGHEAGSDALMSLADILKSVVRSGDVVARWGGDEFVILSIGAGEDNTRLISERIGVGIDQFNLTRKKPYRLACSIGVVPVISGDARTLEDVIAEADEAMYEEKKRRKAARGQRLTSATPERSVLIQDSMAWY